MKSIYRGWRVSYSNSRPMTGTYVATRFGVEVCAASRVAIERMVDTRIRASGSESIDKRELNQYN